MRAFDDLEREKLIATYPTFVGVQAQGCAPLAAAFAAGLDGYERPTEVRTIAHAISNPAPPAGNAVLRLIRDRRGILLAVTDEEMLEAQRELAAAEGLFCQPESATTLAALKKLVAAGRIAEKSGDAVLVLTGSGLKTPHLLESVPIEVHRIPLSGLESCLSRLI
jgi:threonine synthase